MRLFDSHLHIEEPCFEKDLGEVLNRAKEAHVKFMVTSPTQSSLWHKALKIVKDNPNFVFLSLGLQPGEPFYTSENSFSLYLEFLKSNKDDVIAIGEVGLDYKKVISKEEVRKQKEVFLKFIQLSDKYQKPLVIHCRAATEDTVDILLKQGVHGAIMHAFPGSLSQALRLIKNNNYISIPTSIVYSPQKVQIAQGVPLTHLLIETDSPVMSPFKNIRRNEPAFLIKAAEKIAEIKGVSLEKVTEETFNNSIRAYNLILR